MSSGEESEPLCSLRIFISKCEYRLLTTQTTDIYFIIQFIPFDEESEPLGLLKVFISECEYLFGVT